MPVQHVTPRVAIVAPGSMGAAVGRRLIENGVDVVTSLSGRSAESQARALSVRMIDVPIARLVEADVILSIVPPAAALSFAREVAAMLKASRRQPLFVDCNAVSPQTVQRIAEILTEAGAPFVDAGIIGGPPSRGYTPHFYACGEHADRFEVLSAYGLEVRVLDGPVGAASALKMCYAGITKGITAIGAAMIAAAARAGAAEALHREMRESLPMLLKRFENKIPEMFPKAYRWVAEMQEIAEFARDDAATAEIYGAISRLFASLAEDRAAGDRQSRALTQFLRRDEGGAH